MGSGSGQKRRVKTFASGPGGTAVVSPSSLAGSVVRGFGGKQSFDTELWKQHIQKLGITKTGALSYYLDERSGDKPSELEMGIVLRELFIDIVNSGAVQFGKPADRYTNQQTTPLAVNPEDFSFAVQEGAGTKLMSYLTVRYAPSKGDVVEGTTVFVHGMLTCDPEMGDVDNLVYSLCASVQEAIDNS